MPTPETQVVLENKNLKRKKSNYENCKALMIPYLYYQKAKDVGSNIVNLLSNSKDKPIDLSISDKDIINDEIETVNKVQVEDTSRVNYTLTRKENNSLRSDNSNFSCGFQDEVINLVFESEDESVLHKSASTIGKRPSKKRKRRFNVVIDKHNGDLYNSDEFCTYNYRLKPKKNVSDKLGNKNQASISNFFKSYVKNKSTDDSIKNPITNNSEMPLNSYLKPEKSIYETKVNNSMLNL